MRKMLFSCAATLATAAASLTLAAPAEARQGCGRDFHRGPAGRCIPNRGYRAPVLVVGNFYQGRGYWDGRRYWQQRYRHHNGWRYR